MKKHQDYRNQAASNSPKFELCKPNKEKKRLREKD